MKTYKGHIQFEAIGVTVRAKNKREAKKKMMIKVGKMSARRLVDHTNTFVDREGSGAAG